MQSGYRSVKYQTSLYERKTKYYLDKGYDNATAKENAAAVVNPPGYSEHNCGCLLYTSCAIIRVGMPAAITGRPRRAASRCLLLPGWAGQRPEMCIRDRRSASCKSS